MKKTLLALAALGAVSGAAMAQTNVTLYGIADASIGMADTDRDGSSNVMHVFSGVQSSSRIGVRGSEDLGNGLRGIFNLESGVDVDTGAASGGSQFWARRAVVGLAGGFGEIRLGRDYTSGYSVLSATDVMSLGLWGNWHTFSQNGGVTSRVSNGLFYTSPNWGGFTLRAMYAAGEQDGTAERSFSGAIGNVPKNTGNMFGLSGAYANGPLALQAYWQQAKIDNRMAPPRDDTREVDEYGIGAQYRFGMFRIGLNYGEAKTDSVGKHRGYGIGAGVKVGAGEFLLDYIRQEIERDGRSGKPKADSIGLAYVHPLSKRTNLYASYGQIKNKDGASFSLRSSGTTVAGAENTTPKAFSVGIRHSF